MYCANCGTALEGKAKFCANCGHAIEGGGAAGAAVSAAAAPAAAPAASPKKKMARWKKIVLGVVGFVVVVFALAMFLTSGLVDPLDRHLDALAKGDLEAAYAETSVAFRDNTSPEQFAAFVRGNPSLSRITGHSFGERSWENNIGSVKGTLKTSDGVVPVEFRLVKENDQWKILGIKLGGQ